jgi:hypothetical protein
VNNDDLGDFWISTGNTIGWGQNGTTTAWLNAGQKYAIRMGFAEIAGVAAFNLTLNGSCVNQNQLIQRP